MATKESEPRPAGTGAARNEFHKRKGNAGGESGQDGAARRERALAGLGARHHGDIIRAQGAMIRLLLERQGCPITINDVRAALELPDGARTKWLGAAVGELQRAGIIRHAGYVTSSRAVAHARPIAVWALADSAAALKWLAEHPETPAATGCEVGQGLLFAGVGP